VTNTLAMLRLLPTSNQAKDAEILALRHQITVLERQLQGAKVRFAPADRAFLAALLHRLPRDVLRRIRLPVRPETVRRWHRDLIARRHARISPTEPTPTPESIATCEHGPRRAPIYASSNGKPLQVQIDPSSYDSSSSSWQSFGPCVEGRSDLYSKYGVTNAHAYGSHAGQFVYQFDLGKFEGTRAELSARLSADEIGYSGPKNGLSAVTVVINGHRRPVKHVMRDDGHGARYTWTFDLCFGKEGIGSSLESNQIRRIRMGCASTAPRSHPASPTNGSHSGLDSCYQRVHWNPVSRPRMNRTSVLLVVAGGSPPHRRGACPQSGVGTAQSADVPPGHNSHMSLAREKHSHR
jgi:hypothetical protein